MEGMSIVEKFKFMMSQQDSTSNFVGLFLLLQIVNEDRAAAEECWNFIDPKFLDKLILARKTKSTSEEEAIDLRSMGCSILHAFSYSPSIAASPSYIKRSNSLLKLYCARKTVSTETMQQIDEILRGISSTVEGAMNIMSNDLFSEFAQKSIKDSSETKMIILKNILKFLLTADAGVLDVLQETARKLLNLVAESLNVGKDQYIDGLSLLKSVLSLSTIELQHALLESDTVKRIRLAISSELVKPVKGADYGDALIVLSLLLRAHGHTLLLKETTDKEQIRVFVLLCSLAATEVRSSVASLVDQTHNESYPASALRIGCCYDIMRIACLYLITTDEIVFSPDDILKIRDSFSAAFGETISYLRDRWNNSPLCPTAAWHTEGKTQPGASDQELLADPIITSGTQSLCLWLQEDESLHQDACGIIDVLVGLIDKGHSSGLDYGIWGLPALEAMLDTDKGKEAFAACKGWDVVAKRLESLQKSLDQKGSGKDATGRLQDANNDLAVLRLAAPNKAQEWEFAHARFVARIESAT